MEPHILTTKLDLTDIPKGSCLTYVSGVDNNMTYQLGSRYFVLSVEDAANNEYFEVTPIQKTKSYFEVTPIHSKSIFVRLWRQCCAIAITALLNRALRTNS